MGMKKQERQKITPRLLTFEQAADYLGISIRTMREYRYTKKVKCIEMPQPKGEGLRPIVRFDISDLDAFIDSIKGAEVEK